MIKRQDDLVQKRAQLESTLAAGRIEQADARLSLQAAESELEAWRSDWSAKMEADWSGSHCGARPGRGHLDARSPSCFKSWTSHREFQKRIQGIDRDANGSQRTSRHLTARVAPDLESQSGRRAGA